MKQFFKDLWVIIKDFFKNLFHRGKKYVEAEVEETLEELKAKMLQELAEIEEAMTTAVGEELEELRIRATLLYAHLPTDEAVENDKLLRESDDLKK